jgi:hypothetical protein
MNARKKSSRKPLDKVLAKQSPGPIEELERRVAELEKDVALLKSVAPWPIFSDEVTHTEKKRPGAKQKISDEDLFCFRDGLIQWLEPIWPWMEDRLWAGKNPEDMRVLLEAVAEMPELRPDWQQRLLQNVATFFEFLWDERFRKTSLPRATVADALNLPWEDEKRKRAANQLPTRQIADAMAGVPEIAWRTSLDRCSDQPAEPLIALNLDMHYRDKFDIPVPNNRDLTGSFCPVPKSLQPVLTQASGEKQTDRGSNLTTESAAGGSENT